MASGKGREPRPALRHRRPPIPTKRPKERPAALSTYRIADIVERDYELQDVLDGLVLRLQAIEHVRTPEYDERLFAIEAEAAPWALAFLHEISRLDGLVLRKYRRRSAR